MGGLRTANLSIYVSLAELRDRDFRAAATLHINTCHAEIIYF